MGQERLPAIDGLRVAAVAAVILFHAAPNLAEQGQVGVDVFFVISGFVITRLLLRQHAKRGALRFIDFYKARALRLWPALMALCTTVAVVGLVVPAFVPSAHDVIYAMTYTSDFRMASHAGLGALEMHTWSLSVEEQFYLAWPVILVLLLRSRRPLAWAFGLLCVPSVLRLTLGGASAVHRINYMADTRADQLLVGCILALAVERGIRVKVHRSVPIAASAALLLFAFFGLSVTDPHPQAWWTVGFLGTAALSALVVIGCISGEGVGVALAHPALAWVGRNLTYAIYLWHVPVIVLLRYNGLTAAAPLAVATFILSFALAIASRFAIEAPVRRLAVASRRGAVPAEVVAGVAVPVHSVLR